MDEREITLTQQMSLTEALHVLGLDEQIITSGKLGWLQNLIENKTIPNNTTFSVLNTLGFIIDLELKKLDAAKDSEKIEHLKNIYQTIQFGLNLYLIGTQNATQFASRLFGHDLPNVI